ncbi:hypothetical protein LJR090_003738 [Bosea sp. LjRoot90]|uniref:hypothetical protein n=1 Tax=Bosea sp. LjRoot90 TaxID=3342342 RepID=UPI003ECCF32D
MNAGTNTMRLSAHVFGCILVGALTCGPAYAAGGEMPSLFGFLTLGILLVVGFALYAVPPKYTVMLVAALWIGGLALAGTQYGISGTALRATKFGLLMACLTLPIAAGWLLGHVARKRFSQIGTRHG